MTERPDRSLETLDGVLDAVVEDAVAEFLPTRRWFGHKQRPIVSARVVDRAMVADDPDRFALAIVRIDFDEGESARYFLPLAFTTRPTDLSTTIATITVESGRVHVIDAPTLPGFRRWMAGDLTRLSATPGRHGQFAWIGPSGPTKIPSAIEGADSRVVTAEQSNTSIIYDQAAILKLFRRLGNGPNPDAELGRFLTADAQFTSTPRFFGELRYTGDAGVIHSLAVAQGYVGNVGDGWSHVLASLSRARTAGDASESTLIDDARRLGTRTAQMHLALASDEVDPAMRPESISGDDLGTWSDALVASLDRIDRALTSVAPSQTSSIGNLIAAFQQAMDGFRMRIAGFALLAGRAKTRVHGDFHLGQTLRTTDGDFVILDFEGEPLRTIAERRAKTSPLKDVAGMLRSFGYARGAAERELGDSTQRGLATWERSMREAFLAAYFDEASAAAAPFLPTTPDEFRDALVPWELDKALYEVEYELNNRPTWLSLPLTATLDLI